MNNTLDVCVNLLQDYIIKVADAVKSINHSALPPISQLQTIIDGLEGESNKNLFNRMLIFSMKSLESRFVDFYDYDGELSAFDQSKKWVDIENEKAYRRVNRNRVDAEAILKSSRDNIRIGAEFSGRSKDEETELISEATDIYNNTISRFNRREKIREASIRKIQVIGSKPFLDSDTFPRVPSIPIEFKDTKYEDIAKDIRNNVYTLNCTKLETEFKEFWKELCCLTGYEHQEDFTAVRIKPYIKVMPFWTVEMPDGSGYAISHLYDVLVENKYIEENKRDEFASIFTGYYRNNQEPVIKWLWKSEKIGFGYSDSNATALHYLIYSLKNISRYEKFIEGDIPEDEILDILGVKAIKTQELQEPILNDKQLLCKCFTHPNGEPFIPRSFNVKRKVNRLVANEVYRINCIARKAIMNRLLKCMTPMNTDDEEVVEMKMAFTNELLKAIRETEENDNKY